MATAKLTKRTVDAVKPGSRDTYIWDAELPGYGLKVTPAGTRVYIIQYRLGGRKGRTRRVTIGRHGPLTPDGARQAARKVLGEIATGHDPAAERTKRRQESTIKELADRYLGEHVSTRNKPSTAIGFKRLVAAHVIPALGRRRVSDVTTADVMKLHAAMGATPRQATKRWRC